MLREEVQAPLHQPASPEKASEDYYISPLSTRSTATSPPPSWAEHQPVRKPACGKGNGGTRTMRACVICRAGVLGGSLCDDFGGSDHAHHKGQPWASAPCHGAIQSFQRRRRHHAAILRSSHPVITTCDAVRRLGLAVVMDAQKKQKAKSNRMCSVPQCSNRAVAGEISLHVFPRDKKLRKLWAAKMRIGKKVTGEMYVCSEHFKQEDYFWSHLGGSLRLRAPSPSMRIRKLW
ncbi:hypothetical protein HPB50_027432 [Hyalomma asiaticum]|uniref:Uncharacterized protein n=1 Tax=Hyalomma asiaticum TaxID=266040 RepID=A0ACB7SKZ7_HYAAI|nr:hypothetical protein HPB50_027432 [Hyalomma asiaticum]